MPDHATFTLAPRSHKLRERSSGFRVAAELYELATVQEAAPQLIDAFWSVVTREAAQAEAC